MINSSTTDAAGLASNQLSAEDLRAKIERLEPTGDLSQIVALLGTASDRFPDDEWFRRELLIVRARLMLQVGPVELGEAKDLAKALKGGLEFGLARRLLEKASSQDPADAWLKQQLALCTYKDEELHPDARFAQALEILGEIGLGKPATRDSETLALGAAVHKRKWQHGGQIEELFQALALYRAAYKRNPDSDLGYGGVNAAYILDLLASRASVAARRNGVEENEAENLKAQGRALREEMLHQLPAAADKSPGLLDQYWFVVTLAEVEFGLEKYDAAGQRLARAARLKAKEWELETTFRQLVELARLHHVAPPTEDQPADQWHAAWQALAQLLGETATPSALGCYRGKVGLALSGGGFRASFYHLGVLARMAEVDVLRSVDVLSTVSGGSILGAHYYLEEQRLLETKADSDITRQDYIQLVHRVQADFLAGVQKNMRMRALASLTGNLRMIFSKAYSLSHRLGELFDEHLYSAVERCDGKTGPRAMTDLLVQPKGEPKGRGYKPKFSNWRRRARVPVLLVNTTSLNSGHSWFFTASWMGEPPGVQGAEVEVNRRYRRLYYHQAPRPELQSYLLGYAAAASSCVPGLSQPLSIPGLYKDRVVRLVDGGVHDNQGAQGLLDEGCSLILCSDASGQMGDSANPPDNLLGVPLRSNAILMARLREAQYQDLRARVESRALRGLFFVHLRQGLGAPPLNWEHHDEPVPSIPDTTTTSDYGIALDLQQKVASLRTDLDSFTEVEAYALMLSGYRMAEWQFERLQAEHEANGETGTWGGFDVRAPRMGDWPFLALEPVAALGPRSADPRRRDLSLQLDVGKGLFIKAWRLDPMLRILGVALGLSAAFVLVWAIIVGWDQLVSFRVSSVMIAAALAVAGMILPALRWLNPEKAMRGYLGKASLAIVGFLFSQAHLRFFDKRFLARGTLWRLLGLEPRNGS